MKHQSIAEPDYRLAPFDPEVAHQVLDAASMIARFVAKTPDTPCPVCGQECKLFYGSKGHCAVCEWENLGIIPLRPLTLAIAKMQHTPLYIAPGYERG